MFVATINASSRNELAQKTRSNAADFSDGIETPAPLEQTAQLLLDLHPHFRGRSEFVQCRCVDRCLYLDGCLPSYHLKQLAQEALRELEGVVQIENRIVVASPLGEVVDAGISFAKPHSSLGRQREPFSKSFT